MISQNTPKQVARVVKALLQSGAWKATLFLSSTEVVRATRTLYRTRAQWGDRPEFTVKCGRPNYLERDMAKGFVKAGEKFPIGKVQLKFHKARAQR